MPDDPSTGGLSGTAMMAAIEGSLRRLGTDYVDCYLCHFPDPQTPTEETFRTMDNLVSQGKVRYPGCSRFESWRLCEVLARCERDDLAAPICNQLLFNLLDRRIEDELIPFCEMRNIGVTVFAATAIGLLSGRYRYGEPPPHGTSWHRGPYNFRRAMTRRTDEVIQVVAEIARHRGKTPTQVATAWCLAQSGIDCVITGADTPMRVGENLAAVGWQLSDEEIERLDRVSEGQRMVIHKDCPQGYEEEAGR
jgi:aryl-alcohol dehydrogenase-like predicted oxidoreductase